MCDVLGWAQGIPQESKERHSSYCSGLYSLMRGSTVGSARKGRTECPVHIIRAPARRSRTYSLGKPGNETKELIRYVVFLGLP